MFWAQIVLEQRPRVNRIGVRWPGMPVKLIRVSIHKDRRDPSFGNWTYGSPADRHLNPERQRPTAVSEEERISSNIVYCPEKSDIRPCESGRHAKQMHGIPSILRFCPNSDFASCRQFDSVKSVRNAEISANPTFDRAVLQQKSVDIAGDPRRMMEANRRCSLAGH